MSVEARDNQVARIGVRSIAWFVPRFLIPFISFLKDNNDHVQNRVRSYAEELVYLKISKFSMHVILCFLHHFIKKPFHMVSLIEKILVRSLQVCQEMVNIEEGGSPLSITELSDCCPSGILELKDRKILFPLPPHPEGVSLSGPATG
jgi:hypothetical protein